MKTTSFIARFLVIVTLCAPIIVYAQLVVTPGGTALALANMLAGPGVTVSNATIVGNVASYGSFTANGTNLGINAGILLTTGSATNAVGPNNSGSSGSAWGTTFNDANLVALQPGANRDVCKIEFDIVPQCSTLNMNYVFGSEEYPEWVSSSFNDAFGFFISGPNPAGGNYNNQNIATVPVTGQFVSIDNINANNNNAYYVNNVGGASIQYDGMTVPLLATVAVRPCSTYHMKIIIADAGDNAFDSGVFLNAGGLNCPAQQLLNVVTSATPTSCSANTGSASVIVIGGVGPFTYSWSNGSSSQSINNLAAGTYSVIVNDLNACTSGIVANAVVASPSNINGVISNQVNVNCFNGSNGSVTVNATAGTGPFTYNHNGGAFAANNTFSGLSAGSHAFQIKDNLGCVFTLNTTITQPAILNATPQVVANVNCNGASNGSLTVTPTGGSGSYLYSWSNGQTTQSITGIPAGVYSVTLTDANAPQCDTSATVTVTQPTALSIALTPTAVNCNGTNNGAISSLPSGGSGAYTYSWTTTPPQSTANLANVNAGTYTVYMADAAAPNCTTSQSTVVTQPQPLSITLDSLMNVTCFTGNNGAIYITPSGGSGSYSYSWIPFPGVLTTQDAIGMPAGNYSIILTDANAPNCTTSTGFVITQPIALYSNIPTFQNIECFGGNTGAATVVSSGGSGSYLYSWNTNPPQLSANAVGLTAGTHWVYILDSLDTNCFTSDSIVLTQPPQLTANIAAVADVTCFGGNNGSATVVAGGGAGTYLYSWSNGTTAAQAHTLSAGSYDIVVMDSLVPSCSTSTNVVITQPTALSIIVDSVAAVTCYGGSNGFVQISAVGGSGNYLYSWNTNPPQFTDDISGLPFGTYQLTLSDANDTTCQTAASITILQPDSLSAMFTAIQNVKCFGGNDGLATVSVTGGSGLYGYSWNTIPAQSTGTALNLPVGNYTVWIIDTNDPNCTTLLTAAIAQPQSLGIQLNSVQDVTCNGGNNGGAQISATGGSGNYTYSWNTVPAQTTVTLANVTAGNYTLYVADALAPNCFTTLNVPITQPNALSLSINAHTDIDCNGGSTGVLGVAASGGSGNYQFIWNTVPPQSTAQITGLTAGVYTLTLADANALNCTITISDTLVEPMPLTATIANVTHINCNGNNNGCISVVAGGGSGTYAYVWNTTPTQLTSTATNLSQGVYTVTVSDPNAANCTITVSDTIMEPTPLISNISASTNISCNGGSNGSATVQVAGGTTGYTYTWNTNPPQYTATANSLPAGNYSVTVVDNQNCVSVSNVQLSEPTALTVSLVQQNAVSCFGGSDGSALVLANGGSGNYTYSWAGLPNQNNASVSGLSAGNFTVFVNDGACTTPLTVSISQPSALSLTINKTDVSCFGGNNGTAAGLVAGGTFPYQYAWNTTPTQTVPNPSGLSVGIYTLTVTDGNGCTIQNTANIQSPSALTAATTFKNIACFGANTGNAQIQVSGGVSPYQYIWSNTPQTSALATALTAGTYAVTATDANGCQIAHTFTLTEPATPLSATFVATPTSCFGSKDGSVTVSASGGTPNYTYTWSGSLAGQYAATVSGIKAGSYTVVVRDSNRCAFSLPVTVTQPQRILVQLVENNPAYCSFANGSVQVNAMGGVGNYLYSWNTGQNSSIPLLTDIVGGNYTVWATDEKGCRDSLTIKVNSTPPPVAAFTSDPLPSAQIYLNNATVSFENQSVQPIAAYQWSFGDGRNASAVNPAHLYTEPGTYIVTLIVVDPQKACPDTAQATYVILPNGTIYVPNAFSPNGDGKNDAFYCMGEGVSGFQMQIFDRWGKEIKRLQSLADVWEGIDANGKTLPEGVYTYKLNAVFFDGRVFERGGTITIIR